MGDTFSSSLLNMMQWGSMGGDGSGLLRWIVDNVPVPEHMQSEGIFEHSARMGVLARQLQPEILAHSARMAALAQPAQAESVPPPGIDGAAGNAPDSPCEPASCAQEPDPATDPTEAGCPGLGGSVGSWSLGGSAENSCGEWPLSSQNDSLTAPVAAVNAELPQDAGLSCDGQPVVSGGSCDDQPVVSHGMSVVSGGSCDGQPVVSQGVSVAGGSCDGQPVVSPGLPVVSPGMPVAGGSCDGQPVVSPGKSRAVAGPMTRRRAAAVPSSASTDRVHKPSNKRSRPAASGYTGYAEACTAVKTDASSKGRVRGPRKLSLAQWHSVLVSMPVYLSVLRLQRRPHSRFCIWWCRRIWLLIRNRIPR